MVQPNRKRRRRRRRMRTLQPTLMLGVVVLAIAAVIIGIWLLWRGAQPRFVDVMIELGQPMPEVSKFTTKYADLDDVEMLTQESDIQIDQVGVYSVKFRYRNKVETVTLTVRDTTKPVVTLKPMTVAPGTVVSAEDFIADIQDFSETTVFFLDKPAVLDVYGSVPVTIFVQDAQGNETIIEWKLEYTWLKAEFKMEVGHVLTASDLLLDPAVDEEVLLQAALDHITWFGVGTYGVGGTWNGETRDCTVTVVDTTAPELQLKELSIYADEQATAEDFVESVTDNSRAVEVHLLTPLEFGKVGTVQIVQIEALDASGNKTVAETVLRIVPDEAPVFSGLDDIVTNVGKIPDYRTGVTALDDRDGELTFQIDCSAVQIQNAGTYFAIYTAIDSAGNKTEMVRRIIVK